MEQREKALREALVNNAEETARWESYKEDNSTAVENLKKFSNFLTMDVMVPIGRKAYMPGHLIHTNEVLVGHYQNYFSKCSAHKAKEICEYRIKMAEEHLDKLKTECDLWQNKLDKPYIDGVFPSLENHEIIENYDEAEEKIWREKHKVRVKQAKALERAEREQSNGRGSDSNNDKDLSDNDIYKMLEEAELMEEIESEFDNLDIDEHCNETLRKLMAGEMKLPPHKTRIAHIDKKDQVQNKNERIPIIEDTNKSIEDQLQGIVKKVELDKNSVRTNNNYQWNPNFITKNHLLNYDSDNLSTEIKSIKEQAKFLSPIDQIGFYEYHSTIWSKKLSTLSQKSEDYIDQETHILNVLQDLELLIQLAEHTAETQDEEKNEITIEENSSKRKVSFALQNETLEFRKDETISEMLHNRDVIKLDEDDSCSDIKISSIPDRGDRKKDIIDRVEKNLRFIEENQSTKDFQLVDKILESSSGHCYTLRINFKHSGNEITRKNQNFEGGYPSSPADLYEAYLKNTHKQDAQSNNIKSEIIYANAYVGEDKVKVPHLRENDRSHSYEDQRLEFCKPTVKDTKSTIKKNNRAATYSEADYMSAYYKVMNEVVEKPITEPEPLPECDYIDTHTPKKRISRFKKNRQATEKI